MSRKNTSKIIFLDKVYMSLWRCWNWLSKSDHRINSSGHKSPEVKNDMHLCTQNATVLDTKILAGTKPQKVIFYMGNLCLKYEHHPPLDSNKREIISFSWLNRIVIHSFFIRNMFIRSKGSTDRNFEKLEGSSWVDLTNFQI